MGMSTVIDGGSTRIFSKKGMILLKRKLKNSLCVLMSLLILLPFAGQLSAGAQAPLSVFVAADTHYRPLSMLGPIGEQTGLPGDPLYWHTNIQGQLTYESDAILNELLAQFAASSSTALLIPGDITEAGRLSEHLALADKFKQFESKTDKSIFIINGNHDIEGVADGITIDLAAFKSIYADFGYNQAIDCDDTSASYTAELGGGYRLIAVDSCVYGDDNGQIGAQRLGWIENQVAAAKADGIKLIGMMHHSLLEHFGIQGLVGDTVKDYRNLSVRFAEWGIKVVFTGHKHANDISSAVTANGNRIYDIETNCLTNYPNTYRCVGFSDSAVTVESKYIGKINPADLPPGYNQTQLDLIAADFPAYSRGYFNAGMQRYVNEYIGTPRKVAGWLNIEKDTAAYDALGLVMTVFGQALNLPLYDTAGTSAIDSLAEIARVAGVTMPPSGYKRFSDLVAVIVSRMFSGDENTPIDAPEVQLLLQGLKAALAYSFVQIPNAAAAELYDALGLPGTAPVLNDAALSAAAKPLFAKTAASNILSVAVKPLVEGITVDAYSPGDLNETLEAYGVSGSAGGAEVPVTGLQLATGWLKGLFALVVNLLRVLTFNNLVVS